VDPADAQVVGGMFGVMQAAVLAEDPQIPPWSEQVFRIRLKIGPPLHAPTEAWCARLPSGGTAAGAVIGWYKLLLPDMENRNRAELALLVHPDWRRQGVGSALLRHAAGRAAADNREILDSHVAQGSAGHAFATWAGAGFGLTDQRRVLDLDAIPAGTIARCHQIAATAAAGYSLASWEGATPAEHLAGVAEMFTTMNDAPTRAGSEPDIWDADRVRDRLDRRTAELGARGYRVAATCDATGAMVALTELRVDPDLPYWGQQGNTAVARAHRGHRLGLLVKAAMLEWLAEAEPAVRRIATWNSVVNSHMIAINEQLGFAMSGPQHLEVELTVPLGRRVPLRPQGAVGRSVLSRKSRGGAAAWGRAAIPWRS
jgi:GNAT superfamily N-acetyltransferase